MEAKRVLSHEAHPLPSQSEVAGATILIGAHHFLSSHLSKCSHHLLSVLLLKDQSSLSVYLEKLSEALAKLQRQKLCSLHTF